MRVCEGGMRASDIPADVACICKLVCERGVRVGGRCACHGGGVRFTLFTGNGALGHVFSRATLLLLSVQAVVIGCT